MDGAEVPTSPNDRLAPWLIGFCAVIVVLAHESNQDVIAAIAFAMIIVVLGLVAQRWRARRRLGRPTSANTTNAPPAAAAPPPRA